MEDFILGLLWGILELVADTLIEYVFGALLDLLLRALGEVLRISKIEDPLLASLGYLLVGLLTGGLSLLWFPHRIVHRGRIPGLSLVASPVAVGLLMSLTGSILRRRDKRVAQIESFAYGFAFALGMALVRFWFAK